VAATTIARPEMILFGGRSSRERRRRTKRFTTQAGCVDIAAVAWRHVAGRPFPRPAVIHPSGRKECASSDPYEVHRLEASPNADHFRQRFVVSPQAVVKGVFQ